MGRRLVKQRDLGSAEEAQCSLSSTKGICCDLSPAEEARYNLASAEEVQAWFARHVTLEGEPYTLDRDQAAAVLDRHRNTLVTARAGSGKTRVIVAKTAYLVAVEQISLSEIAIFMFNRTAAAEVNERIARVKVDGRTLPEISGDLARKTNNKSNNRGSSSQTMIPRVASTFHKFALNVVRMTGLKPEIIDEATHDQLVRSELKKAVIKARQKISPADYADLLKLTNSFIARAGQKFCGEEGLARLSTEIEMYVSRHGDDPTYQKALRIHQLAFMAYLGYLEQLRLPKIDFNLLMQKATEFLEATASGQIFPEIRQKYRNLRYLMIDEYQDFSYLFYAIVRALRMICCSAHLFAVGDDWQAINRFAGSDVDYFLNFEKYFPEDYQNIPLLTNYRSDRIIVENANDYMLKDYCPGAERAIPFSRKNGKIYREKLAKVKFDRMDILEDGLGDGRYQTILIDEIQRAKKAADLGENPAKAVLPAARMLKKCVAIIRCNRHESIMLLHRHNFTSTAGVDLVIFGRALGRILEDEAILTSQEFAKQIRIMTMHKSKGLEADVVILLELDRSQVLASHPFATMFEIFDDNLETEKADQHRLLYVALTRAKHKLYILTNDKTFLA